MDHDLSPSFGRGGPLEWGALVPAAVFLLVLLLGLYLPGLFGMTGTPEAALLLIGAEPLPF